MLGFPRNYWLLPMEPFVFQWLDSPPVTTSKHRWLSWPLKPFANAAVDPFPWGFMGRGRGKMNREAPRPNIMAVAERGSFLMALFSITQIWLAIKMMGQFETWLTTILGASGAACVMVAIVLFKQEQRDLLLNPLKSIEKEVHPEEIAKQGRGAWMGVAMWFIAMVLI